MQSVMHPNIVHHIRKFVSLNDGEAETLLAYIRPISIKKKENLLEEGQACKSNYFVEKGCLRMFFVNEKGVEQTTQFAIENWWISDYMSFDKQTPSHFYIQSVEPTEAYAIDLHLQNKLFDELPQLEKYFRIVHQRMNAAAQFRIKYFRDFSKDESYQHFVSLFPDFVQRVPQYMLASYLGLTPEYLSEIRKKHS